MPIGDIQPPSVGIQDEPTACVKINQKWLAHIQAMIRPASFPEWWGGTLEENRFARKQVRQLMWVLTETEDCGDMNDCCVDIAILQKVDVTTGQVVISTDGGTTYTPAPNTLQSVIVTPVPAITSGVADNKCDAAKNVELQIEQWVDKVTTDFDTATSLIAFASGVLEAILLAVLTIVSAGILTTLEASILPLLGAALSAAWAAGKVAFVAYWTEFIYERILCAVYTHIGDDGSFTDAQFSAVWNQINSELPPSPAKMLLMGWLSSGGAAALNAMAASGQSSGFDCTFLHCDSTWCFTFDFLTNSYSTFWSGAQSSSDPVQYSTTWSSGIGWKTSNGDPNYSAIKVPAIWAGHLTRVSFVDPGGSTNAMMSLLATSDADSHIVNYGINDRVFDGTEPAFTYLQLGWRNTAPITSVTLEGVGGLNPFGADNC